MYDKNNAAVGVTAEVYGAAELTYISNPRQNMEISESELIAHCQKGELERFGQLYDQYVEKIYRFVYFRTRHKETAEDLTSQIFQRALEGIKSFNSAKGRFSPWLYQIARNAVTDHWRVNKPMVDLAGQPEPVSASGPEKEADAVVNLELVRKYLSKLSPQQRDTVIMRVWDGLSHREIAEILGLSEANSKMIFSRVIVKLRQDLPAMLALLLALIINV